MPEPTEYVPSYVTTALRDRVERGTLGGALDGEGDLRKFDTHPEAVDAIAGRCLECVKPWDDHGWKAADWNGRGVTCPTQ